MTRKTTFFIYLTLLLGFYVNAQVATPFKERFSQSIEGDVTIIANNMVSRTVAGDFNGQDDNHDEASVYVDIDDDPTTFNSSSANFTNPEVTEPCISILRAFLYWSAADRSDSSNTDNQPGWNFNEVKLMLPGETTYTTVVADEIIYSDRDDPDNDFSNTPYVCVKDISSNIIALGESIYGNYQVGNVEAKEGDLGSTGTAAGWQIVLIYESPELPAKNITLFDGYAHIESNNDVDSEIDVDFDGFVTIPTGPVRGNVVMGALEGDRGLVGDQLKIMNIAGDFVDLVAPERDPNNFFNSRITIDDADFVDRNPASTNTLGFDAAVFELDNPGNTVLDNASTETTLRMTSDQETYGLYLLGLAVEVFKPNLDPMLIIQTAGSPTPLPGDLLEFNFYIDNRGNDDVLNLMLSSNLSPQVVYEPLGELPSGVTSTYNEFPDNLLVFEFENGILNEGSTALGLNMGFRIKEECYFLEENCDLDFGIQFEARYNGSINSDDPLTSTSTFDPSSCIDTLVIIEVIQPEIEWATAPLDLDRRLSCEDTAGLDAAQLLEPIADKCEDEFGNGVGALTLNKTSGTFVSDPDCPSGGTYENTWNFTDACGVTIANYVQTITIEDLVPPTASNPETITVQCIEDVPDVDPEVVMDEADNCSVPTVRYESQSEEGTCPITITRIYSVIDACGNIGEEVAHVIIVEDNIKPTASNPETITVQCIEDVPDADPEVVIDEADNCSVPEVRYDSQIIEGTTCPITITRKYFVRDACGNEEEVSHVIIVEDKIKPTASNPETITVQCIEDVPDADPEVVIDEADNCSVPEVRYDSQVIEGTTCPITITRKYFVRDACGNEEEVSHVIIVEDKIKPTASNPETITVQCIEDVPDADPEVVIDEADNCSVPEVRYDSQIIEDTTCPIIITRKYFVRDACGNEEEVTHEITVIDDIMPELISPLETNITVGCGLIPEVPVLEFTDNCSSNVNVDFQETTIPVDSLIYTLIRTWTASDNCGNEAVFTQEVSVEKTSVTDRQQTVLCIEDGAIDLNDYVTNTNVLTEQWTSTDQTLLSGSIFETNVPVGNYEFIYTYTNSSSCVFRTVLNIEINEDCVQCEKTLTDNIDISKLVTPNNDGVNDFLEIKYDIKNNNSRLCAFSISLDIYNRWGTRVYSNKNYNNAWQGESRRASAGGTGTLPTGTYYYTVRFNDTGEEIDPIQGFILLGNNN